MTDKSQNTDYGKVYENGMLVFERLLPGPLEKVWAYIVDGDKRARWFSSGNIPSQAGQYFTMTFNHTQLSGEVAPERFSVMREPVSFDVKLLSIDAPHQVSFTWPEGDEASEDEIATVTITLTPQDDKVLLRLTQTNPRIRRDLIIDYLGGWHSHLGIFEDVANNRPPRPFWTTHAAIEAHYQQIPDDKLLSLPLPPA
ncbi:SRPBCC family protein [Asticcacaulis tiandongensis]|uniref:SRPBCC family protein n=1 Tax=Asticcacaulis tiandongensis TaxID=2565365 RepID=UPI00112A71BD|nr:SRPBCC family protein [Asticcacaulis tiandongensis]